MGLATDWDSPWEEIGYSSSLISFFVTDDFTFNEEALVWLLSTVVLPVLCAVLIDIVSFEVLTPFELW